MTTYENELYHHGIPGQKWGVRRYQNPDGTLTEKGRKRLSKLPKHNIKYDKLYSEIFSDNYHQAISESYNDNPNHQKAEASKKRKPIKKSKPIKEINNQLSRYESTGHHFVNQNHIMQTQMEQARWASEQATRASINASLQGASLSMTGGTNPFMFGMM